MAIFLLTTEPLVGRKKLLMKHPVLLLVFIFAFAFSASSQTDSVQTNPAFTPLRITAFDAKLLDRNVQLQWTVSANEDVKSFDVEKEEGGVFRKIGSKLSLAKGGAQSYEFVDALPKQNGDLVYRLKLLTKDGNDVYSASRAIGREDAGFQYKLKQNPVRQLIDLEIDAVADGQLQATVTTAYGQKLLSETSKLSVGKNKVTLSAQDLLPGLHRLMLECGGKRALLSFVKE